MLTNQEVLTEIRRSRTLHGPLTKDLSRASLILARETLEVLQEAHDADKLPRHGVLRPSTLGKLRCELVQVIAVAVQWIDNIDLDLGKERNEYEHHFQSKT